MGAVNRPSTLPGQIGNRPGGRPDRPTTLPGRPGDIAGIRPGGGGDRPIIGGGGNRPRPEHPIAGGGNRPGGDRPGWGDGNRPGWGNGNWQGNWNNWVNNNHNHWYNGCWHGGYWGAGWYAPLAWGATAWGMAALWPSWGYSYGETYANPYYVSESAQYDYSQPIVVENYASASSGDAEAAPPPESPEVQRSYSLFDQAREAFKKKDYRAALQNTQQAIRDNPKDAVLHEFAALCQFALGDYAHAAAGLNSVLAAVPGMDWTSLVGLYSDVDEYTKQLRTLEDRCRSNPDDAAAQFVLAYHYLVAGHTEAAAGRLKAVAAKQPNDQVSKRLLASLQTPEPAEAADEPDSPDAAAKTTAKESPAGPTTDLVGSWQAKREGDAFELSIDADGGFAWKAQPKGKKTVKLAGSYVVSGDMLVLDGGKQQGAMVARVASGGPDAFQFATVNAPPGDKGLAFQRIEAGKE